MAPSFSTNWGGNGTTKEAIQRKSGRLGDRFGVPLRTAARAHADPEEAILQQLRIGERNLIVMGVSPPAGDHAVVWGRGGDGAAAIPPVHLVGRELIEAELRSRYSHQTSCHGTVGVPFSRLSEARTPAIASSWESGSTDDTLSAAWSDR